MQQLQYKRMMPARWNKRKDTQIESRMHEEYVIAFLKPIGDLPFDLAT